MTSFTYSGLALVTLFIVLGAALPLERYVLAGYLLVFLLVAGILLSIKVNPNYRKLFWLPMLLSIVYIYNFFENDLCISEPLISRLVSIAVCVMPLVSVYLMPTGGTRELKGLKVLLGIPCSLLLLAGLLISTYPLDQNLLSGSEKSVDYKLVKESRVTLLNEWQGVYLYEVQSVVPGYERRILKESVVGEHGEILNCTIKKHYVVVDYTDYGQEARSTIALPFSTTEYRER